MSMLTTSWRSTIIRKASRNLRLQSTSSLPDSARVVIVGGGIIGTSIAYHLAHAGIKDVVLLERDKLTSGTTWHAAGLMATFGSLSESSTELRKYSKDLYANLEKETGLSTGFSPVGFIELASTRDRLEEYRRVMAFNRKLGVDVKEISPEEVKSLFPIAKTDDLLAGFYVETDGRVNPVDVTMSLAKGAKMQGATLLEGQSVDEVLTSDGKVTGVRTTEGHVIKAEYVVNSAGMWARQLAAKNGVICPNQAAEHYYLITDKMEGVDSSWPVIEDPENYAYIRPEGEGLMVGLFEGHGAAWNTKAIPNNFSFGEIEPDFDRLSPYLEKAMSRVPTTLEVGAKKFFCGPESFTPDNGPIIGEAPEIKNYFIAAGLNSIGILTGGGIGRLVAHWIKHGHPDMDVTHMYPDRFRPYHSTPQFRHDRTSECLANVYAAHYPYKLNKTGRGVKRSPLHECLDARKAVFRDVSGWECADFFCKDDEVRSHGHLPLGWGKHHWFENWKVEHEACRNSAVLFDMSFMSKWLVQGRDAGKLLDYLSTSRVDDGVLTGAITYTQWVNRLGRLEADLTVIKLTDNDTFNGHKGFMVIATDSAHRHVETRMKRYIAGQGDEERPAFDATVVDVTGGFAQITIQGPNSRQILQASTDHDMSGENFPFRTAREISIGYAPVICTRITYVGELGYELFVPTEQAVHVHDCLMEASERVSLPLTHAGLKALSSLRMEKGYRDYGHDIDNTDTLLEAGLGFTCDFTKTDGFVGMEAVLKQKELGVKQLPRRLLQVLLSDPEEQLFHGEVVYCNDQAVGDVRTASYGHSLGGAVGLAMISTGGAITKAFVEKGRWEVDVGGRRVPATASIQPMFDPTNKKIKA